MKKLQKIGFILSIVILVGMFFISPTKSLPFAARNTLGLTLAVIVLLVTDALPIGVTCMAAIALMVTLKCTTSVPLALTGFTNQVLFFTLASFGISEALTVLPLSRRFLVLLMKGFGKNSRQLLLGIMICVAVISSIISNVAAAAVFIPMMQKFLLIYEDPEERARTTKSYMIGLPVASMIGGMMTPAGSSINLIAISQLEKNTGMTIPFVQWMAFGIPLAFVLLPIAWFFCVKIFRPANLSGDRIKHYVESVEVKETFSGKEKYVIIILSVMLVLWILSSWISAFNITVVALLGLTLFFIPKIEVLTWKQFEACVSWPAFFLTGTMISLSSVITSSGLGAWIATAIFPAAFSANPIIIVGFVAILTFVLLIPIPVAPALVMMLSAPMVLFAKNIGISPYILIITLGLCAGNCYLLPLDAVPQMTFATGSYKMFDMPKVTVGIQLIMIVLSALLIPVVGVMLGII